MSIPPEVRALARRAKANARRAYAPYSRYRVGAVVETVAGEIFDGANIENAAYPLGFCAERVAIALWRTSSENRLVRILVWTEGDPPGSPCGLCRDALLRWAPGAEIWLASPARTLGPYRAHELLPGWRSERESPA